MNPLNNYINSLENKRVLNNSLEITEGDFIIKLICKNERNSPQLDSKFSSENIDKIIIKKYNSLNTSVVDSLYYVLHICYETTNKIAKYSLNKEADNLHNLSFEVEIYINESKDFNNVKLILMELSKYQNDTILQKFLLSESNGIDIIQTNTKTRRIGYLKIIIELFQNSNYFPCSYLGKKIESNSILYSNQLIKYGKTFDDKGLIKPTNSGSSAKPYIELLEQLNLLTQINNSYILTKQCKIYLHLNNHFNSEIPNNNSFHLNLLDKLFFLRQILISDTLYTWAIIDLIRICQKPIPTNEIKKLFVSYVMNELNQDFKHSTNSRTKKELLRIKSRISSWTNATKYLEHIVEPRVNWLLDLGLLRLKKESNIKKYHLSNEGKNLANVLTKIHESNLAKHLTINSFISKSYLYTFNYIFDLKKINQIINYDSIDKYLLEAFKIFKTEAPNRIAASQGIDYVCFKSFFVDGIIIEFDDLKNYLLKPNNLFTLDWFKTENDGALYLKK